MSEYKKNQSDSSNPDSFTVKLEMNECINTIITHIAMINGYRKESEPWQKRELESAIICGENLVKIRQRYGKPGTGFKQFIIDEFANEFSYVTALRYMKLYNGRNEMTNDVANLRQAYIKLGILKESYSYPDNESDSNGRADSNDGQTKQGKQPKQRKQTSKRSLNDLLKHSESIYMTRKDEDNNSSHTIYEFNLTSEKVLIVRRPVQSCKYSNANAEGIRWFLNRLKPIVDWHNEQTGTLIDVTPAALRHTTELKMAA
jgi:hypothetical protein